MTRRAILVLEDGSVYEGVSFGAETDSGGEVVFNTSMTGYQEMLTDPSYAGQILVPTYPLIGNYGINPQDEESRRIQVRGFVVREECRLPNHFLSGGTVDAYLKENNIPGIAGVDTRAITHKLRSAGVMMGYITSSLTPAQAMERLKAIPDYGGSDFVKEVSTGKPYQWGQPCETWCEQRFPCFVDAQPLCGLNTHPNPTAPSKYHIVALDCGLKYNILRILTGLGCRVTAVPCTTPAEAILKLNPDGVLLSPGPGNPDLLDYIVDEVKKLIGQKPVMGICLGNQLIARAFGGRNFKLKFGHRGGNHPVKELSTGRVHITAQNHGYAVDPDSLKDGLEVSHINLNDGTVEGLRHRELPLFAIQYHSEASPGPLDNTYLFEQFIEVIEGK